MKAIKILFLSVFLVFLINTVSAVVVYGEWNDNDAQSIKIEDRDSVDFSTYFATMYPPMTINIGFYDSNDDLIHSFEDTVINKRIFAQTYTVNKNIYLGPGDFQVRILGSDGFGEMSAILYLKVINNPPVITSTPITEVNENEFYEHQVVAVDPDNHPLSYSLSVAPGWLSINSDTGLITGTAPEVDTDTYFDIEVVVSDSIDTDTQFYTLKVIWIPNPSLSQTVELVEDVKVKYNTILSELDSAILEIYYKEFSSANYELIVTRDITTSPYTETFNFYDIHGATKGDYRFVIRDPDSGLSETDEIAVPDYVPEVDLSSILANFNEEGLKEINLPIPTDINPEDEPVPYLSVTYSDKTSTYLDPENYLLTLTGNRDETGDYEVELEFGDPDGETATAILEGEIYNLPDISGILENNEEDLGEQGVIRVYYINPNNDSDYIPLEIDRINDGEGSIINGNVGKIQTTFNGTFDFQINKKASELEIIILQARIGSSENYTGYVRTIKINLSDSDNQNVLVRAVPYAPYEDDPQIFRQFMSELCSDQPNTRFDFEGEYIKDGEFDPEYWPDLVNYTGLIGIEILSENPFGAENGTFTEEQQENMKSRILDLNDISGIIGDYNISEEQIFIVNGSDGHFDFYEQHVDPKGKVVANPGWIIIVPYKNMPFQGLAESSGMAGTLVYRGVIYLKPGAGGGGLISHEFGHTFIGSGHPEIMPPNQTIMSRTTILQITGPADKKAGKLIYEKTFMTFSLVVFPEIDFLYNILGLGFYGESQITGTVSENLSESEEEDFTEQQNSTENLSESEEEDFTEDQQNSTENLSESEEDDEEDFTEEQQDSTENNIIGSDDTDSSNSRYVASSNSNSARLVRTYRGTIAYRETIHLQSSVDSSGRVVSYESDPIFIGGEHPTPISLNEKTVVTPLSNIIQQILQIKNQVISFISQKLKSTFAIYLN